MRVFISHSFKDNDFMLLSRLGASLVDYGLSVSKSDLTPRSTTGNALTNINKFNIAGAKYFIGLVSWLDPESPRLQLEWQFAMNAGMPHLLLVEGHQVPKALEGFPVILFNRTDNQAAINYIESRLENEKGLENIEAVTRRFSLQAALQLMKSIDNKPTIPSNLVA